MDTKPKEILNKLKYFLKPGGKMVIHEYYFWTSHRTQPEKPALKAIAAALQSFKDSDSEIDVGKYLHEWFDGLGMEIFNYRLMPKLATPNTEIWEWPKTFYQSYFPRLVEMGLLTNKDVNLHSKILKFRNFRTYYTLVPINDRGYCNKINEDCFIQITYSGWWANGIPRYKVILQW